MQDIDVVIQLLEMAEKIDTSGARYIPMFAPHERGVWLFNKDNGTVFEVQLKEIHFT